jgi:formylglycine-generating enzyme required for sulfatase activity
MKSPIASFGGLVLAAGLATAVPASATGGSRQVPSIGLELVAVSPGTLVVGGPGGDADEQPETRVTLSRPYWLGKFEVTQGEWVKLMPVNPSHFTGNPRLPVETVGFAEAEEFCRKLTETERAAQRLPFGYVYRLPTEAEWEFACRAGTRGNPPAVDGIAWYVSNSGGSTHPVGQKTPNDWGFYDMQVNVCVM